MNRGNQVRQTRFFKLEMPEIKCRYIGGRPTNLGVRFKVSDCKMFPICIYFKFDGLQMRSIVMKNRGFLCKNSTMEAVNTGQRKITQNR